MIALQSPPDRQYCTALLSSLAILLLGKLQNIERTFKFYSNFVQDS